MQGKAEQYGTTGDASEERDVSNPEPGSNSSVIEELSEEELYSMIKSLLRSYKIREPTLSDAAVDIWLLLRDKKLRWLNRKIIYFRYLDYRQRRQLARRNTILESDLCEMGDRVKRIDGKSLDSIFAKEDKPFEVDLFTHYCAKANLSFFQKRILRYSIIDELTQREIAVLTDYSCASIHRHLDIARALLRKAIVDDRA